MKNKKIMAAFGIFLGFMLLCTIIAKGLYTSGLPVVFVEKPTSNSLVHEVNVSGKVKEGQVYGVCVDSGLRVATIKIRKGEAFSSGDPLFQIDTNDLRSIIEMQEQKIQWLSAQKKEEEIGKKELSYAKTDYDLAVKEFDLEILRKQMELQEARDPLRLYEEYLAGTSSTVSQGDSGQVYNRKEKLEQLRAAVSRCEIYVQEALLEKETGLIMAKREVEIAEAADSETICAQQEELLAEIDALQKHKQRLQELLEANGWVYASRSGKVTEINILVGNRTQDMASILYALDEGKKIVEADFTKEQTEHLTPGCEFQIKVRQRDGSTAAESVILSYLDKKEGGDSRGEFFFENDNVALGQTATLSFKKRTDIYEMCIRKEFIHQSGVTGKSVFVVEEQEGILGTEQRVRSVPITILDENDTMAAIESVDIMLETRIVASASRQLEDGDIVRVME